MNDLIVNVATRESFMAKVFELTAQGRQLTHHFLLRLTDRGREYPGSWGYINCTDALPEDWLFVTPDVEYRYNSATNEWVCNGPLALGQNQICALHDYFVSLGGAGL